MRFRSYDHLRTFTVVARHGGLSGAARELNLTKGAISHQIKRLEHELRFEVFDRHHGRFSLTHKGRDLLNLATHLVEEFEQELERLQRSHPRELTVGMSTYFAARWLTPRLMSFMQQHPDIRIKLQPTVGHVDPNTEKIDLLIRWGDGSWKDLVIEKLFDCPGYAVAGSAMAASLKTMELDKALKDAVLLHDIETSPAWMHWFQAAGYVYRESDARLVIPDPNVRIQAVINNQGLGLYDDLAWQEIDSGQLQLISDVRLKNYGYFLAFEEAVLANPAVTSFKDWITSAETLALSV